MTDHPTLDDIKARLGIPDAVITLAPNQEWYWISVGRRTPDNEQYHSISLKTSLESKDDELAEIKQQIDQWWSEIVTDV